MISKFSNKFGRELFNKTKTSSPKETKIYFNTNFSIKIMKNINFSNSNNNKKIPSQKYSKFYENENARTERINLEKEIEKTKLKEENRELNITRRNTLKKDKEKDFQNLETEFEEVYTVKEYENLISDPRNKEIILYRMSSLHKTETLERFKRHHFFISSCFIASFFIDFIFPVVKTGFLMKFSYYSILFFDYGFFLIWVIGLLNFKGITISAKYFHEDKVVEFTYFNLLAKEKIIKENLSDLKRITTNENRFSKLKSIKTNKEFVLFRLLQEINYRKLINYLCPKDEVKIRKKPSMVDSLWEKN